MTERYPELNYDDLTPEQKILADRILKFSMNGLRGPWSVLMRSPVLGGLILDLGDHLRFSTGIDDRLLELAILTHARCRDDQYEWKAHYPRALDCGLSVEIAEAIRRGEEPKNMQADEALVYDFARQISANNAVNDQTFAKAKDMLGEEGVTTLIIFLGQYAMVSTFLAAGEVKLPDNGAPLLEL